MRKMILTAREMRELEDSSAKNGVVHRTLMENAGKAAAEWILMQEKAAEKRVVILCGKGNNGGDGYVIAERIQDAGGDAVILQTHGAPGTPDSQEMCRRATQKGVAVYAADSENGKTVLENAELVMDAIYGIGFHGKLDAITAEVLQQANRISARKIAIDIPSGVECDTAQADENAFRADVTLTFSAWKPAQIHTPAENFCGKTVLLEIGIPECAFEQQNCAEYWIDSDEVRAALRCRPMDSNKGTFGKLLCVCGSYGMAGAAVLAVTGALRSGVGLVQAAIPERIYPILAGKISEPVMLPLPEENPEKARALVCEAAKKASAVLFGCGIGVSEQAERQLTELLQKCSVPMVLDADGINLLVAHKNELKTVRCPIVLTPHPGEMARLCGKSVAEVQANRLQIARNFAKEFGVVLVLKGHHTLIAEPGGVVWVNPTGNSGMAKGGSGDLLAGMLGALLAQGVTPLDAAKAAVWLHGAAGDRGAARLSETALQPSDMALELPGLFLNLEQREGKRCETNDRFLGNTFSADRV